MGYILIEIMVIVSLVNNFINGDMIYCFVNCVCLLWLFYNHYREFKGE